VASSHPFAKNILKKEYSVVISPVFSPKKKKYTIFLAKIHQNCLQHARLLKVFSLPYRQIWLNIFMNHQHLSKITELKREKKTLQTLHTQKITAFLLYIRYINNYIFIFLKIQEKYFGVENCKIYNIKHEYKYPILVRINQNFFG
jgi:hypothetical protein